MRIYVVRHGHKANQLPDYDGGANTPLSDRGLTQAERVAEALADEGIDRVYSSAQLRALQTAAPVAAAVPGGWHVWPLFCETSSEALRDGDGEGPWGAAWPTGERIDTPTAEELAAMDGNYYLLSEVPDRFPGRPSPSRFPGPRRGGCRWRHRRI